MFSITSYQENANQSHSELLLCKQPLGKFSLKQQEITNVGENMEKPEPLCTVGRKVNGVTVTEEYRNPSKIYKQIYHVSEQFHACTFIYKTKTEFHSNRCCLMFTVTLQHSTSPRGGNNCPWMDGGCTQTGILSIMGKLVTCHHMSEL